CHRQNMKTSIINGSEVSRLSVAIQVSVLYQTDKSKPTTRAEAKAHLAAKLRIQNIRVKRLEEAP
ncbi:hypothetical protein, partial [Franconibacter helveticus]|uniref:hypothetical protein n=1 Tax=Franconibacter helveticus TaxID=357240 RepID=UPI00399FDD32